MTPPRAETMFEEMKRYVRFTDEDARRLGEFAPVAAPHFDRIAGAFYERIREHDEAHAVLTGEEQIGRLHRSMVRWLERLFSGPFDENYFEERARIGRVHVKIGLPQRYMLTGMSLVRVELEKLTDALATDRAAAVRIALARILDLELAIMLETYREDFVARIQRVDRQENETLRRALAKSEQRYESAVELARVLVVGLDAAGHVVLFNREAERVTGYARDEVAGRGFVETFLTEPMRVEGAARLAAAAQDGRDADDPSRASWETTVVTRTGKKRVIRWQLAPPPSRRDGDDVALYAIGTDVTDERALRERTLQSEKLAAVGTLAAGLAHEIRNPMNGALLHLTFLERALKRDGDGNVDALRTTKFIGAEIQRLSALVRDFLVFARPAPAELKPTSLREICQRSADLAQADASRLGVTLVTDFASSDVVLQVDGPRMEQVLLNLLRNAIESVGGAGGGRVVLRTRRQPRHATIEVEDEGPGLSDPTAPIFDAFYSTKPNGTGLGLAIVHRAVTDHGGSVEVESRPGCTVFRVALPLEHHAATEVA